MRLTAMLVADIRRQHIYLFGPPPIHREAHAAADRLVLLDELVGDLVSPEDCYFDHHGYCQAHMWFETDKKCPHARAKELR